MNRSEILASIQFEFQRHEAEVYRLVGLLVENDNQRTAALQDALLLWTPTEGMTQ